MGPIFELYEDDQGSWRWTFYIGRQPYGVSAFGYAGPDECVAAIEKMIGKVQAVSWQKTGSYDDDTLRVAPISPRG